MAQRNHFFNPFLDSFLGVLTFDNKDDPSLSPGMIIENLDLYFQPVPDPITATIFLVIMLILVAVGSYISIKVMAILKKEDSLLTGTIHNFMVSQLISWPLTVFIINVTNFIHSFPPMIVQWICPIAKFFLYFCMNFTNAHSCITAVMRYVFIVHNERVQSIGKEKVKQHFLACSFLIPLLLTLWRTIDGSELDTFSFNNKCYGIHHKSFLIETSTLNVFKKNFCNIPDYKMMNGYLEVLEAFSKNVLCLSSTAALVLVGSNLTEGIIYYMLFSHMNK